MFKAVIAAYLAAVSVQVTVPTERVLAATWHHQEHNLSCEAAALRIALSALGIDTDENTLLAYLSPDLSPARFDAAGRLVTWGDPQVSFVGNPDGHIEGYTGYGVYNQALAQAALRAGAGVYMSGSGLYGQPVPADSVYAAVMSGKPAVVWISNTYHQVPLHQYVAYDGSPVSYTLTEHAVTVVGVSPDAVLIDDPWFGQAWHSKSQFESAYATFDQMAVVLEVYRRPTVWKQSRQ